MSIISRLTSVASPRRKSSRLVSIGVESLEARIALTLGGEINVSSGSNRLEAATASSSNGSSVIVWTERLSSTDSDIKALRYDSRGNPVGSTITINNTSSTRDSEPAVAMDSFGDFVVSWTRTFSNGDKDIRAARFSSAGVNRSGVNSSISIVDSTKPEYDSSVAVASNGDFVVSYTLDFSSTDRDVKARMYRDNGSFVSEINVAVSGSREYDSQVARAPSGQFAITYTVDQSSSNSNVMLKRYSAAGGLVNTHTIAGSSRHERRPSVSMDNSGNSVVAFEMVFSSGDTDIKARRVSNVGVMGGEINVQSASTDESSPVVSLHRTNGRFVVAYTTRTSTVAPNAIRVTEVSASDSILANITTVTSRSRPSISINAAGDYMLAYNGTSGGIFRRRGRI